MTMKRLRRALVFLAACGCSDLDDDEAVCTASVSVSGYITASLPEQLDCYSSTGPIDMGFTPRDEEHPLSGFNVIIPGAGPGETGMFAARVLVFGNPTGLWETDACVVTIDTHDDRGQVCHYNSDSRSDECEDYDTYRLRGHGECQKPAYTPDGVPLTIGPFEFARDVWWPR